MLKTDDKLICQLCKQPITGAYTTYTTYITEGSNSYISERIILCDCCDTEFKQLMDREEEPL